MPKWRQTGRRLLKKFQPYAKAAYRGAKVGYKISKIVKAARRSSVASGTTLKNRTPKRARVRSRSSPMDMDSATDHNDMSRMVVPIRMRPGRLKRTVGSYRYRVTKQGIRTSLAGTQAVFQCYPIMLAEHINGNTNDGAQSLLYSDDLFQLQYKTATAANTIYVNQPGQVQNTDLMGLKGVNHELNVLNMNTSPIEVHLYYWLCKKDTLLGPDAAWARAIQDRNENQAAPLVRTAIANANVGEGTDSITRWGANPGAGTMKRYYRKIGYKKFVIQGGNQTRVKARFNYNKILSREVAKNAENQFGLDEAVSLAGYTIWPQLVVRSGLVGVAIDNISAAASEVTYGPIRVGILQQDILHLCSLKANSYSTNRVSEGHLQGTLTGAVFKIINDEDEAAQVVNN